MRSVLLTGLHRTAVLVVLSALIVGRLPPGGAASAAADSEAAGLPDRVVAGYWTGWAAPRLAEVPAAFNTIYLFSARPVGGPPGDTGAVYFEQHVQSDASLVRELAQLRDDGRSVILTVGGAGRYLRLDTDARTDAFVESIRDIHDQLGGFDGLDWNIESSDLPIDHMVAASVRLKEIFGSDFAITTPPAPWRQAEISFVEELRAADALDFVTPQYYDMPGFGSEAERRAYAVDNISRWVDAAGGAHRVGFGFRNVGPEATTMTVDTAAQVIRDGRAQFPQLRGAMVWSLEFDRGIGDAFAAAAPTALGSGAADADTTTWSSDERSNELQGDGQDGDRDAAAVSPDGPGASQDGDPRFGDIADNVHRDAIVRLTDEDIVEGYPDGSFRPEGEVTRGQLAALLVRALDLPARDCADCALDDIDATTHAAAIRTLVAADLARGYGDGRYGPADPVTRAQVATLLQAAFDLPAGDGHSFVDVTSSVHEPAVASLVAAGVTEGRTSSTFAPREPVRRDQLASLLARSLGR